MGGGDIVPVLLGGMDALFLKGSLRRRRKPKIADWLASIFSFARRSLILGFRPRRYACPLPGNLGRRCR